MQVHLRQEIWLPCCLILSDGKVLYLHTYCRHFKAVCFGGLEGKQQEMSDKEEKDVVDTTEHGEDSGNETGWKYHPVTTSSRFYC